MKQLIFGIIIALLAVIFALQNTTAVVVNLFFWNFSLSLALLIILLLILGIVTGILIMSKTIYNKNSIIKSLQKINKSNATVNKVN